MIFCKHCGSKVTGSLLTHYYLKHPDYSWPKDWSEVSDEDN